MKNQKAWLVYDKSLFSDKYGECGDIDEFMSEVLVFLKEEEANDWVLAVGNSNLIVHSPQADLESLEDKP